MELKRQKERERYAQNKDDINRKRREARKMKKDKAANLDGQPTTSSTPVSNMNATTVNSTIMATGESAVIQLEHIPTLEGTLC